MATSQISIENVKKEICSVCQKESGVCSCTGCKKLFCRKDFNDHCQWLSEELEKVVEDRDQLKERMNNKEKIMEFRSSLLTQIDQWENGTLEKVHRAADRTRHHIVQFLDEKDKKMENEFKSFTKQLLDRQNIQNINENDLTDLKNKIHLLEKLFEQLTDSSSLMIHTEKSGQIDWALLIYADDESAHDIKTLVPCLFADAKCRWIGTRDRLYDHVINSSCGSVRAKLHRFNLLNEQLHEQIRIQKKCINQHELEIQQKLSQKDSIINVNEIQISELKEEMQQLISRINTRDIEIQQRTEELKKREHQININKTQILQLQEEIKWQKSQTDNDKKENQQQKEQLKQKDTQISVHERCIHSLKGQLSRTIARINENETRIQFLKGENDRQSAEINSCKHQIQQITQQATEWEDNANSQITRNQQLSAELSECRNNITLNEIQLHGKEKREQYHQLALLIVVVFLFISLFFNIGLWISNTACKTQQTELVNACNAKIQQITQQMNEWKDLIISKVTESQQLLNTELAECRMKLSEPTFNFLKNKLVNGISTFFDH